MVDSDTRPSGSLKRALDAFRHRCWKANLKIAGGTFLLQLALARTYDWINGQIDDSAPAVWEWIRSIGDSLSEQFGSSTLRFLMVYAGFLVLVFAGLAIHDYLTTRGRLLTATEEGSDLPPVRLTLLEPRIPGGSFFEGWPSAERKPYRFTAIVESDDPRNLEVVALRGMKGYGVDPSYGDFNLQWDVHPGPSPQKVIRVRGSWKVHILAAGGSTAMFLGPMDSFPNYKQLDPFLYLCFVVELRDVDTDEAWQFPLLLGFDRNTRKPWMRPIEQGECDDWHMMARRLLGPAEALDIIDRGRAEFDRLIREWPTLKDRRGDDEVFREAIDRYVAAHSLVSNSLEQLAITGLSDLLASSVDIETVMVIRPRSMFLAQLSSLIAELDALEMRLRRDQAH